MQTTAIEGRGGRGQRWERVDSTRTKLTVNTSKHVDGNLDNLLSLLRRANRGNSPRSQRLDLLHDLLGRLATKVINDDISSQLGVHERVSTAKSSSCAGNDDGLVVEADGGRLLVG